MNSIARAFKRKLYFIGARYFLWITSLPLRRWSPEVIVITGSVGKTTLLNILEVEFGKDAHYSHNANSAFGLAFDVVGLRGITGSKLKWFLLFLAVPVKSIFYRRKEKFYIAEVDADRPKEAEMIGRWLKPDYVIWVSSEHSHAANFKPKNGSVEKAIADAYARLARLANKKIIYDSSSSLMESELENVGNKIGVSISSLETFEVWPDRSNFKVSGHNFVFSSPLPKTTALQLAMMTVLLKDLKRKIVTDLSSMALPPGRSTYFDGINGLKIIDSSYNAHNISVMAMVDMLEKIDYKEKWLVLGDIIDQGEYTEDQHKKLAEYLVTKKLQNIVLVGKRTNKYVAPILRDKKITHVSYIHPNEALNYLQANLTGDELILFKGSQYLEGIIKHLLKDPADEQKLCRREPAAEKRRIKYGVA